MLEAKTLLLIFLVFTVITCYDENDVQRKLRQLKQKKAKRQNLQKDLSDTQQKLDQCLKKLTSKSQNNQLACQYQQSENKKLTQRVKQLIENKAKQVINFNEQCDVQCKTKVQTFKDKIINLQKAAEEKAKQFANKLITTKTQWTTRLKNFVTGKGPYNREDEQMFSEFKNKVSDLQSQIQQKVNLIDNIRKQKADIDFQQKYCKATLGNIDYEISELERQAQGKGKYYINQIKRLQQQREKARIDRDSRDSTGESRLRDKISQTQRKLKDQLQSYDLLYDQKRQCQKDNEELKSRLRNFESQNNKLKQENDDLKKLIREIYSLKNK